MALRIEDYALIGNTCTGALVGRDGSIDWLCFPRFDSPACFAALLGTPENGRWRIAPKGEPQRVERRYRDGSLILETRFELAEGAVTLIDFMPFPRQDCADVMRIIRCDRGSVDMVMEAIFRFDYGTAIPWVRRRDYGLHAIAGPEAIELRTELPLENKDMRTECAFRLSEGQEATCSLTWYHSHLPEPGPQNTEDALAATEAHWRAWSDHCATTSAWSDAVVRSLITLKALTYSPTGGMVAAATTSLPEQLGGVRNWDYRHCWLRDATFALYALLISGYREEAKAWREWLLRAVAGEPSRLQIMYGLAGERRLHEHEVPWLAGYADSRPVRIGNHAYTQVQMDIYGEVMDAFHLARRYDIPHDDDAWRVQCELAGFLEKHWNDPGSGMWELRGEKAHHTSSMVMSWVALDRSIKAVERFGLDGPVERWRALRQEIHDDICSRCFDAARNRFVQSYENRVLDASLLLMPLVGFLPIDDPRIVGTVEAVQRELTRGGLVWRYPSELVDDGLPRGEGAFLVCSFWLADCLAMMGRRDQARALFEHLLDLRNDVGLLAEQYDPRARRQLGNFPQAYSHVGIVNTAHNLTEREGPAEERAHT